MISKYFTGQTAKDLHDIITNQLKKNYRLVKYFEMEHLALTNFFLVREYLISQNNFPFDLANPLI